MTKTRMAAIADSSQCAVSQRRSLTEGVAGRAGRLRAGTRVTRLRVAGCFFMLVRSLLALDAAASVYAFLVAAGASA